MPVWSRLLEAIECHGTVAMVTLAAARGSSPREAGARMIVNPDATFSGTIGGGALEWQAIAIAQAALGRAEVPKAELRRFALGPELGQCCGGQVELLVEIFGSDDRGPVAALARREAAGSFATLGRITAAGVDRTVADRDIPPGAAVLDGDFIHEGFGDDRRPLILFGAGHVGRALVLALAPLPFSVTWIDPRSDAFPAQVPANVSTIRTDEPGPVLSGARPDSFVLVMTHSHQLDLALVHAALADGRFPYVGLIGSKTKRARFERRLAQAGLPAERIGALVCPIGVEGVRSKLPAAIAAATVAQLLTVDEALRVSVLARTETSRIAAGWLS
jgi:xanthine dehydrogenase accessory factor